MALPRPAPRSSSPCLRASVFRLGPFSNPKSQISNLRFLVFLLLFLILTGCLTSPNRENIELRKKVQTLEEQIAQMTDQRNADLARIAGLQTSATTLPVLPQDRLDAMFTVHGIKIGRLTGGFPADQGSIPTGLRVYVEPTDETGSAIKATGDYTIEAFDLAKPDNQRIGHWAFPAAEAKKNWYGMLVSAFVFTCPWQTPPEHAGITIKVTFRDELTARLYTQQTAVTIPLAPAPTTQPARP